MKFEGVLRRYKEYMDNLSDYSHNHWWLSDRLEKFLIKKVFMTIKEVKPNDL